MSPFVRVIVLLGLLGMVMGYLLLQADEMPAEVEEMSFLDTSLGMLVLSSVFLLPTLGSLGIIALANKVLTIGGGGEMKYLLLIGLLLLTSAYAGIASTYVPVPASPAATHVLATSTTILDVYKIPSGYYGSPCLKPSHLTFYDWLGTLEIPPYEQNAFDCSQMAAYVEWLSENCNHRATIVGKGFEGYGHIWVLIDLGGIPFAFEPGRIGNRWVPRSGEGSTHFHYDPDLVWEDIYEAPWAHDNFEREFAWWESYPELMKGE